MLCHHVARLVDAGADTGTAGADGGGQRAGAAVVVVGGLEPVVDVTPEHRKVLGEPGMREDWNNGDL